MSSSSTNPIASIAQARWLKPALWCLFFGAVVALRLLLPSRDSDTLLVHQAIVESLLAGHNWGRQALVGALEYPLLPTLGLLAARVVCGPASAASLLVALSQAWAVCYLLRLRPELPRRAVLLILLAPLVLFLPDVRAAVTALDPNWVAAVPFCAAVFHLVRWFRTGILRDAVLCAANAGLLGFCGLGGILTGLALAVILARDVRPTAANRRRGVPVLVWAPLLYCLGLWFLWSWLILGDLLFCLKHFWGALMAVSAGGFLKAAALGLSTTAPVLWACLLFLVSARERSERRTLHGVLLLGAVLACARALCLATGLLPGAASLLVVCGAAVALALVPGPNTVETVGDRRGRLLRAVAVLAGILVMVADMMVLPRADPVAEGSFAAGAPTPTEITQLIDRDWPRSRTAVFGVRLPALYHDPLERRFVARMDCHEELIVDQGRREVMHLLLPPPDGRFYPRGRNVFTHIYAGGSQVLLLEKQWNSGWQLWRCVVFPDRETRLQHLR
jgi:hypothetical protein